jgi:hypothetical protein
LLLAVQHQIHGIVAVLQVLDFGLEDVHEVVVEDFLLDGIFHFEVAVLNFEEDRFVLGDYSLQSGDLK